MFLRRHKLSLPHRLREFIWPRMGWKRAVLYVSHRLARLPGTPYSIAAGFACGAAVSFTPLIGFHFILAGLLAWALRANILASAIGTVVGNPWTFPFIWFWTYRLGGWILARNSGHLNADSVTFDYLFTHPFELLLPMLVGSIPFFLVVWLVVFWPLRYLVALYQQRRYERRRRKHDTPVSTAGGNAEGAK